jgi:hypothetical protein
MKKLLISAGAIGALALSTPAFAATSNSATANATVNIVSPLQLTNTSGLNFGTVVGPFSGSVVRVSNTGGRTCGSLTCSGTATAATFSVTGTANQNLKVTVDPSVTMNSGANSLLVDLTTDLPTGVTTGSTGTSSFGVGGSLTIPALTPDGLYTGTFNVRVDYQ